MTGEFDIIRQYFTRNSADPSLRVGIGDDGAVIQPTAGHELVVVTDTLVAGRHFPADARADDIGWRALAVNLSDCAAMAATPRFAFLALSLPEANDTWLEEFAAGFFELAERDNVVLAGGDTTRGPLVITVTVLGEVPSGKAVLRSGARVGDRVLVTGWPGRARAALETWQRNETVPDGLQQPWRRPDPRTAAIDVLRESASACIDVSDGLVADLGHLLTASGGDSPLGATLEADALPIADALVDAVDEEAVECVLFGGDDYELLFTCAPESAIQVREQLAAAGVTATAIGVVEDAEGLRLATSDGNTWELPMHGFDHFSEAGS